MAAMCFFIIGPLRMTCALVVDETESDRRGVAVSGAPASQSRKGGD